jgi:hypothetical protein
MSAEVTFSAAELHPFDEALLAAKRRAPVPHEFVLDALSSLSPVTRPMFGCLAVYVEDRIVLILRNKPASEADNGVWLVTSAEHHESLRQDFPWMRSIQVIGANPTSWQLLPADAPDFEEAALRACELVLQGDPRIGKVPKARSASRPRAKQPKAQAAARRSGSRKGRRSA